MGDRWSLACADSLDDDRLRDYIWELSYALAEAKDKLKERA
tara:strand:+ start:197 stop:319 length:123 start_codon:yes stop_codon:yes gene_type:complete